MENQNPFLEALNPLFDQLDTHTHLDQAYAAILAEHPQLGLLFAAHCCMAEICNGGFFQLYTNSTGYMAPEAVEGFIALGKPLTANCIAESLKLLPQPYIRDWQLRVRAIEALCECKPPKLKPNTFTKLEDQFLELFDEENGSYEEAADGYVMELDD